MLKRYEKYKKINDFWINRIPKSWNIEKMKYLFREISEKNHPDETPLVASQHMGVVPKNVYGQRTVVATKGLENFKLVNVGDFVISLRSFQGGLEYAYYQGIISPAYTILRGNSRIESNYFKYLAKSYAYVNLLKTCVTGIREGQNVDYNSLKNHLIPIPPRPEQDKIVQYLDWKTSEMNRFIHQKKKQIKLLEELKRYYVDSFITNGIKTNRKTYISKATWMGTVPIEWKEYRLKNIVTEVNNRSELGLEPHLSMSQKKGLVTDDEEIERRLLSESYAGAKICEKDELVLNRLKAHLGVFALAPIKGVVSPDYTVLHIDTKKVLPKYLEYLLKSNACRRELVVRVRGIVEGFWRLYTEDLGAISICIPGLEEQEEILSAIEQKDCEIDEMISSIQKEISLVEELKVKLVSDVVIGQVDVRDIKIPTYETETDNIESDDDSNEQIFDESIEE